MKKKKQAVDAARAKHALQIATEQRKRDAEVKAAAIQKTILEKEKQAAGIKKAKKKRKRESQAAAKYEAQMKVKQEKEAAEFAAAAEQAERDSMDLVSSCLFAYTVNE